MGKHDPPSPQLLDLLHYVEDLSGYIHSKPRTTSDAARILWFHIRRLRGLEVEWPLAQPGGIPGVVPLLEELAGVTSLQPDALAALTGAIRLLSGANITLSEVGQDITITGAAPGISSLILFDSTLAGAAGNIDTGANGIAQTAVTLVVDVVARTTEAVNFSNLNLTFNGDVGGNYDRIILNALNATASASNVLAQTQFQVAVAGANLAANAPGVFRMVIPAYRQTTFHKAFMVESGAVGAAAADTYTRHANGRWRSTAAINQITATASSGNLVAGSRMTVYGLL